MSSDLQHTLNDIVFLGSCGLVALAFGSLPFIFFRFVRREKWYWLPLLYGSLNGVLSVALYLAALWGLFGGPIYFLLVLLALAYFKVIPLKAVPLALTVEILSMVAVFFGVCWAIFP